MFDEEWDITFISDQDGRREEFKFFFDENGGQITGEVHTESGPGPIPLKGSRRPSISEGLSVMHFIFELRGNSIFLAGCQIATVFEGRYGAFAPAVDDRASGLREPGETGTGGGSQQTLLLREEEEEAADDEASQSSDESAPKGQ